MFSVIKFYYIFILVPGGRKKIWPCKVGRDEKSLKSTGVHHSVKYLDLLTNIFFLDLKYRVINI